MTPLRLILHVAVCFAVITSTWQSTPKEDDNQDIITKLSEQLERQSNLLAQQSKKMAELTTRLDQQTSGPTFIRWGRKTCDGTGAEIVYTGIAGGTHTDSQGGAANLLCLPRDPTFANYDPAATTSLDVHGVEYVLPPDSNFPFASNDPLLLDTEVPCAACQVTNGSSIIMIPARVDCYSGWKLEYRGYLMSETGGVYRTEFVCVDENAEPDYNSAGASISGSLYPAESVCDSLPCPPYDNYWELACVVCSK